MFICRIVEPGGVDVAVESERRQNHNFSPLYFDITGRRLREEDAIACDCLQAIDIIFYVFSL
jgi:hypothetical protein